MFYYTVIVYWRVCVYTSTTVAYLDFRRPGEFYLFPSHTFPLPELPPPTPPPPPPLHPLLRSNPLLSPTLAAPDVPERARVCACVCCSINPVPTGVIFGRAHSGAIWRKTEARAAVVSATGDPSPANRTCPSNAAASVCRAHRPRRPPRRRHSCGVR